MLTALICLAVVIALGTLMYGVARMLRKDDEACRDYQINEATGMVQPMARTSSAPEAEATLNVERSSETL